MESAAAWRKERKQESAKWKVPQRGVRKKAGICKVVKAVACRMEKSRNLQNGKCRSVA